MPADELEELRVALAAAERRIARLERTARASADSDDDDGGAADAPAEPEIDRRQLLKKVVGGAAVAAVGGAGLVATNASPAAADVGVFDGDPAVDAHADPASGTAIMATAGQGIGVDGLSDTTFGVRGTSNGQTINAAVAAGVLGLATGPNGAGVLGQHETGDGPGVVGESVLDGAGVLARSEAGPALRTVSTQGIGVSIAGARAQLALDHDVDMPPPETRDDEHTSGEIYLDSNLDLWLCVLSGIPGTWQRIAGPETTGALVVLPTPVRVYDSRSGYLPATGPKSPLPADTPRTVDLSANSSGVPDGASAVLVNLVATGTLTSARGWLAIYRNGVSFPGNSNVNWSAAGQSVAVTTVTAVDSQGRCVVYAGSTTDVVVDVVGYYR